ncbi:MAG: hypothetical protein ACI86M_002714 [Saprospiraceae bacterium]|jgi:hypothetical protein
MIAYPLIIFCVMSVSLLFGQNSKPYTVDRSNPISVVNAIFYAANTSGFTVLDGLCDPGNRGNDDTKMICMLSDMTILKKATVEMFIS